LLHSGIFGALGNELVRCLDDIKTGSVATEPVIKEGKSDPVAMECEANFWGGNGSLSH
jgi:hypothetical protein